MGHLLDRPNIVFFRSYLDLSNQQERARPTRMGSGRAEHSVMSGSATLPVPSQSWRSANRCFRFSPVITYFVGKYAKEALKCLEVYLPQCDQSTKSKTGSKVHSQSGGSHRNHVVALPVDCSLISGRSPENTPMGSHQRQTSILPGSKSRHRSHPTA